LPDALTPDIAQMAVVWLHASLIFPLACDRISPSNAGIIPARKKRISTARRGNRLLTDPGETSVQGLINKTTISIGERLGKPPEKLDTNWDEQRSIPQELQRIRQAWISRFGAQEGVGNEPGSESCISASHPATA
jgi:hypothetical protein